MRLAWGSFICLTLFRLGSTASTCVRDDCYSVVVIQNRSNPPTGERKTDCRAIFEADVTITTTETRTSNVVAKPTTVFATMTQTFTQTVQETRTTVRSGTAPSPTKAYSYDDPRDLPEQDEDMDSLAKRHSTLVQKIRKRDPEEVTVLRRGVRSTATVPSYATMACQDLQEYASACKCFGARGEATTTITGTAIIRRTYTPTTTIVKTTSTSCVVTKTVYTTRAKV